MTYPDESARTLSRLTTRERVAQMVFPRVAGLHQVDGAYELHRVAPWLRDGGLGGVIVFGGNLFETAGAINALQKEADIPLLVASDLEGGAGQQISGATRLPPAMALGASEEADLARLAGRVTATEARAFGIHLIFAPVADLNVEPDNPVINTRAFGENPAEVARRVVAWIEGCREGNALATVKHFPGHGATVRDSHLHLPVLDVSFDVLEKREWVPFRAAIEAAVPAVMVGHLLLPALDPERPAGFSPRIIRGILRERLGFDGLVVSDALTMGGAIQGIGADEAAVRAAEAGCDILLHPEDPMRTVAAVTAAVESGRIPESTVEAAARRILGWKERIGLFRERMADAGRIDEMLRDHEEAPRRIAAASLCLMRNRGDRLPLPANEPITLVSLEEEEGDAQASSAWVRAFHRAGARVQARRVRATMAEAERVAALSGIPESGPVVVGVFSRVRGYKGNARLAAPLREALAALEPAGPRTCVVSFGNPYVLETAGKAAAWVAAHTDVPATLEATADALLGRTGFPGTLPVRMKG